MGSEKKGVLGKMEDRIIEWFIGTSVTIVIGIVAFYVDTKATTNDVNIMKSEWADMKKSSNNPLVIQEQMNVMREMVKEIRDLQKQDAQNNKEEFRLINERMNKFSDTQIEMFKYVKR